jgi:hypothetical protein
MIIAVHGFKQSGKDTLADLLVKEYGFKKVAFADKLKDALHVIFNVPKEDLWGSDEDKKKLTTVKWSSLQGVEKEDRVDEVHLSIRELMQIFATEICRSKIPGIWYEFLNLNAAQNIVVSDLRFDNEASFLRSTGAYLFKVKRQSVSSSDHLSERGINDEQMDCIFSNNDTLENFLNNSKKKFEEWLNDSNLKL